MSKPVLIVVGGATASGKTSAAIRLATHFQTEIISTDSRQFYKEMSIGTAKPTANELSTVKHHFIDSISIHDRYSVGDFERDALNLLNQLYQQHQLVIAVGGSGLFVQALCEGLDYFPNVSASVLNHVNEKESREGIQWLRDTLANLDPDYFNKVDRDNPARLRRAVEVSLESGQPYSSFLGRPKPERPFDVLYLLLEWPRPILYDRINQRVDEMIRLGLESEARTLYPFRDLTALKTVGYEEWWPYFEGEVNLDYCVDKIKQHTRNYAKRQGTWFDKYGHWHRFDGARPADLLTFVEQHFQNKLNT